MKKIIAYILCLSILTSAFSYRSVLQAEERRLTWRQTATMDLNLSIIEDKTGKDDLLFAVDMAENGRYQLEYFLQDGERKTLEITNNPQDLVVDFKIDKGTQAASTNQTRAEMEKYFLSADFSGEIPVMKSYRGAGLDAFIKADKLHYKIDKNASAKFPGVAFNINNKTLMLRADFNSKKAYIYLDKYQAGTIVPVKLTTPDNQVHQLNALKNLNKFTTSPTHLVAEGAANKDLTLVEVPNANAAEKAGFKPGIRVEFEQPKALNTNSWNFEFDAADTILEKLKAVFALKDLAGEGNMDISFSLNKNGAKTISSLPEANDTAVYKVVGNKYQIDIVADETGLINPNEIVKWSGLEKSKIYKASLNFGKIPGQEADIDFPAFTPNNEFAYTYMEFTLKRANTKEAYLEITPYDVGDDVDLEYTVLYSKAFKGQLEDPNDLWLKHYQRNDENQTKINIPVPFLDNSSEDHYQILFRFSSTNIRSQLLNYQADKDKDVPPAMPNIVLVDNLYVTPPDQDAADQSNPSQIQFDLVWDAMEKKELDSILTDAGDAVYYELSVNTLPGDTAENKYEVIKVYQVTKQGNAYQLSVHPSLTGDDRQGTASQIHPQYTNGYDKIDELFRVDNIILYKNNQWPLAHKAVYDEENLTYTVTAENDQTKRIKDLSFPGVNYLRLRTYVKKGTKVTRSRLSLPHSMSLSMIVHNLQTVNNLNYEPIYRVNDPSSLGVGIKWDWNKNKVDYKTYKEAMLDPLGKTATSLKYVGYISQGKQKLMKIGVEDKVEALELVDGPIPTETSIQVKPEQLLKFRENEVYYFEVSDKNLATSPGGEFLTQIKGLDPNEVYYVRFVVELQVDGEQDAQGQPKPRTSTPSVILEVTVPKLSPNLSDDEKLPLAPEEFRVDFVDGEKIQTFAEWKLPKTFAPTEKNVGFELINVEDQSMDKEIKETEYLLEELVTGNSADEKRKKQLERAGIHKSNVQAYRVVQFDAGWQLEMFDKADATWKAAPQADFSMEGDKIKVIDKKNSPNRVLYYYVRTVKYNDQRAAVSRSRWREATLTTPELKRPINLAVDYFSSHEHNPKLERIIYFDVPMPEGVTLHDDYLVQIFIRGEKDHDFVESTPSGSNANSPYGNRFIKSAVGAPPSYQRVYYKIYGLEPGKSYDIKVRLEDRTKDKEKNPDGILSYTTSPFSDVVKTRTEFDQMALDKENKYKEYLEVYVKQAEELKKKPFFPLSVNGQSDVIKYRGPYAAGEMRNRTKQIYDLEKGSGKSITYYLPAELIKAAPEMDTDLRLWIQEQAIVLPNGFVTETETAAIKDVIRKIKEYNGSVKDYAVMILLTAGKYNGKIEGNLPLEPMVNLTISVVRQTRTETYIDNMLLAEINNAVNRNKKTLIDELEKELRFGIKEDKLNDIVNKVLKEVEKDFAASANYRYLSLIQGNKDYISQLEREMSVWLKPQGQEHFATLHREGAKWKRLEKEADRSNKSIKTGSFVAVYDENLHKLAKNSTASERNEITKNRLGKVFTTQEMAGSEAIYGQQVIRTAARILGAGDSNDTEAYLKSQGIKVPGYQQYGTISKEKAYYILAQVYAKKRNIQLKNVKITDYNSIEDSASIDSKYQKDLLAAHHLKVFGLRNGQFLPKSSFTMKDLKEFLRKL